MNPERNETELVDALIDAVAEDVSAGREDQSPETKAARAELIAALQSPAGGEAVARVQRGDRPHDPLYAMLLPGVDESKLPPGTPLYTTPPRVAGGVSDAAIDRACRVVTATCNEDFDSLDEFTKGVLRDTQRRAYDALAQPADLSAEGDAVARLCGKAAALGGGDDLLALAKSMRADYVKQAAGNFVTVEAEWDRCGPGEHLHWVLQAGKRRATPSDGDGVRVPREPTPEMEAAAVHAAVNEAKGRPWFPFAWRAAIAAAPTAKEPSNG